MSNSIMLSLSNVGTSEEELLQTLLDVSLSGMVFLKPVYRAADNQLIDFDYVRLNRTAQAMLDLPEHPSQSFLTLNAKECQAEVFIFYRDTFLSGEPARFHANFEHNNGSYNYSYLSAARSGSLLVASFADTVTPDLTPIAHSKAKNGADKKLAVTERDSEKTRAALEQLAQELEERVTRRTLQLEQERQRFSQIFEKTPALIAILQGPNHTFSFVNPAFQNMFPERDLVGNTYAQALPEVYEQGFGDQLNKAYTSGAFFLGNDSPVIITDTDGSTKELYFNFTFQPYGNERTEGIFIFAFEVSSEVEIRKEAERQRELLHTIFMEAPSPIVILRGPELIFQLVNPAYQQIFPGRELLNKTLLEALPELGGTPLIDIFKEVYKSGETFVASEMPIMLARHTDGPLEEMFFTFTYQARRNTLDKIGGVLVFAHEVTNQVHIRREVESSDQQTQLMAQELASTNEELRAANEEILSTNNDLEDSNNLLVRINIDLDNFIYTASHDLKAPISNIEGLLAALMRSLTKEASIPQGVGHITELMQLSVDRFKRTLANLTDVVKLQKENNGEIISVNLCEIIKEVQLDIASLINNADAQLNIQVDECSNIHFSVKNLRSVVYNLLSNAIKYCCPDRTPVISIICKSLPGYHLLTVTDNGLGMDKSQLANLFTMFRRFHNHVEGSGIGLYMVKKMVENAGGKIEVESQQGVGTSFKIYFLA